MSSARSPLIKAAGLIFGIGAGIGACLPLAADISDEQWEMYEQMLRFPDLVQGGTATPVWKTDGSSFLYLAGSRDARQLMAFDATSGDIAPVAGVPELRRQLADALGHTPAGQGFPAATFSLSEDNASVRFSIDGRWFEWSPESQSLNELLPERVTRMERAQPRQVGTNYPRTGAGGVPEVPSPDGSLLASLRGHNLWLRQTADGRLRQLSDDGGERNAWSTAGASWSPDGMMLAAIRSDNRQAHHMPVVHWLGRAESVEHHLYAQAGGGIPRPVLKLFDVPQGTAVTVDLGEEDFYLRPLNWTPDGSEFLFFWLSRDSKRIELRAASRRDGATRLLWQDESKTFIVSPMNYGFKPSFRLLADGRFVVSSEQDGWNHLYLYGPDRTGGIVQRAQLTRGNWPVTSLVAVDEADGWVYFNAHPDSERPYDTHLMRVNLEGEALTRLTDGAGHHSATLSPSHDYFVDTHSAVDRPPQTELRRADGSLAGVLAESDISRLENLSWKAPEPFTATAADGSTELHGIIRKPWNFDPSRQYPVVEYIYGGAQVAIVPRTFVPTILRNHMIFAGALTQLGFIVVSVDARGTPERGKEFQDVVYGNWGRNEIADHAAVHRQLEQRHSWIDGSRRGVFGSSYGGYFTTRAMLQAPDVYHVGVASAPATELHTVFASAIESYMGGRPQEAPAPYDYASNLRIAGQLEGKFLILHPTSDINAPFAHAVRLIDALIQAGKPHDVNIFPEGNHHYMYPDSSRRHVFWWNTVRDYFVEHLDP